MTDETKTVVMDKVAINRALVRIAHEIIEKNKGASNVALIGIRKRGVHIAERLVKKIKEIEKSEVPLGYLDVSFYRDDVSTHFKPEVFQTDISFDITDKDVVLVDDVLFTGRTTRAAMDALIDFGRPASIQLAVLIDRGHRELPIRSDFVGKNIPTAKNEDIQVNLKEEDGEDSVIVERGK